METEYLFERYEKIVRVDGQLYALFRTTMHGGPDVPMPPRYYTAEGLASKIRILQDADNTPSRFEEIHQCANGLGVLNSATSAVHSGAQKLQNFPEYVPESASGKVCHLVA